MDNFWMQFFQGYVRVQIKGRYVERFINRCLEEGIAIWHITRQGDDSLLCSIDKQHTHRIRPLLRKTDCTLYIKKRTGFPFIMKKIKRRLGFVTGLLCFLFVLIFLSNIV